MLSFVMVAGALGSVYDVTMPLYKSTCQNGCLPWAQAAKLAPSLNLTRELEIPPSHRTATPLIVHATVRLGG